MKRRNDTFGLLLAAISAAVLAVQISSQSQSAVFNHDLSGNLVLRTNSVIAAPLLVSQPSLEISDSGSSASFAATVSAPSSASFQWRFNDASISGATNANLLLNNLTSTNKGAYSVVVSNSSGVVTSSVARLIFNFDQIKVWGDNSDYEFGVPNSINQNALGLVDGTADVVGLSAGNGRTFALKANGTVVGWGKNDVSQCLPPAGLSNVVQVAVGSLHNVALKADGTVSVWGNNTYGQTNIPVGLSNIVSVATTLHHTLALKSDGSVVAWGNNADGETNIPPLLSLDPVVGIAAGNYHSLALKWDGTVAGWGYNGYGETTIPAGATNVVAIAAGHYHSLALRANGTVIAWGRNNVGQTNVPAGLTNVIAISSSYNHNLALRSDGTVVAWGANESGQTNVPVLSSNVVAVSAGYTHSVALLGADANELAPTILRNSFWTGVISNSFSSQVFTKNRATSFSAFGLPAGLSINPLTGQITGVPTGDGVFQVTITAANDAGTNQTIFFLTIIRPLPKIYSPTFAIAYTGNGFSYQVFANNSPTSYAASGLPPGLNVNPNSGLISGAPQAVGVFPVILSVANSFGAGAPAPLSIRVDSITAWGNNTYGQTNTPLGLSNIVAVSAGDAHNVALRVDGTVVAWGYNGYGQTNVPAGLSNVVSIAAAARHTLALKADGSLVGWGDNSYGQTNIPAGLTNVVAMDAEYLHNVALQADGTVVAWGNNADGETSVPGSLNAAVAVAAGYYHTLALQAGGTVVGWGYNNYGEVTTPAGLSNVVAIAAGDYHSLALKSNGTVVAWGYNGYGETNVPAGLSNVVALAAEYRTSFALKSDGSVVAWGYNTSGQTNVPAMLTNLVAISEGGAHSLALTGSEPGVLGPMIVSRSTAIGALGTPFYYRVLAKNGATIFGASGLPPGLAINPVTGVISGTPIGEGMFGVTLSAGNSVKTNQINLSLTIARPLPRVFSANSVLTYVNSGFTYQILANNGPTSYSASGLPSGLSLDTGTGVIIGTPNAVGVFVVTLVASNGFGIGPATTLTVDVRGSTSLSFSGDVKTNGTLAANTVNAYIFNVTGGNSIALRVGAPAFTPRMDIYDPNGVLIGSAFNTSSAYHDAYFATRVTNGGPWTVIVTSYFANGGGDYTLNVAKIAGDSVGNEAVPLTNGVVNSATNALGDLNVWSFTANSGDGIVLRMGAPGFTPLIDLYGPDGAPIGSAFTASSAYHDAALYLQATNSGKFTVVTHSYYYNGAGAFTLQLAKSPGAFVISPGEQGGTLTNGTSNVASNSLGGMDMWSFTANAGDGVILRMGAPDFTPRIDLYGPNGALVGSAFTVSSAYHDTALYLQVTNGGTFTAIASSYYYNGAGTYTLQLAESPGAFVISPGEQGGTLTNGTSNAATNSLGDLDMWSFTANAGDGVVLRMGAPGFTPRLDLYGPNGNLVSSAFTASSGNHDATIYLQMTNGGTFTAVASSYYYNGAGNYTLHLARAPGAFVISPGEEGGALTSGTNHDGIIDLGDLDLWKFTLSKSNNITVRCEELSGGSSFNPRIRLFGPNGTLLTSAVNASVASINYSATNNGDYTVLVDGGNLNDLGTYRITISGISNELNLRLLKPVGTNLIFVGTGGTGGSKYTLFSTTNLSTPLGLWSPILTNQFDASGNFVETNLYDSGAPRKFFLLQQQ